MSEMTREPPVDPLELPLPDPLELPLAVPLDDPPLDEPLPDPLDEPLLDEPPPAPASGELLLDDEHPAKTPRPATATAEIISLLPMNVPQHLS
jgi:hypothetical protein